MSQVIEDIELSIEQARRMVKLGQMAQNLAVNKDFKELVIDGYFRDEAARMTHLYADPNISEEIRAHVHRDIVGPGAFKRYLSGIVQMGNAAAREILEAEETLVEVRQEMEGEVIN